MHPRRLIAPDLRVLFLTIARVALAAAPIAGCGDTPLSEANLRGERSKADDDEQVGPHDGGAPLPDADDAEIDADDAEIDAGDAGTNVDGGNPLPEAGPWDRVLCGTNDLVALPEPALALAAARQADFLGIFVDQYPQYFGGAPPRLADAGAPSRFTSLSARVGEACSGVTDSASCEQELARLKVTPSCAEPSCTFALLREGAHFTRYETRNELIALFGSIDTAAEAVLLAAFDERTLCSMLAHDPLDIGTEVRPREGGGYDLRTTIEQCSAWLFHDELTVAPDGTLTLVSHVDLKRSLCVFGRRPDGFTPAPEVAATRSAATFLARAAELEAASIYAFYQLLLELRAHGAPAELQELALDAMLDEVRHARAMGELACAYGAEPRAPELRPSAQRSLLQLALDNVGEGCVRETFGALLATYQAESASDPRLRTLMAEIAQDETRHASLSWQLAAWLEPQLSSAQRVEVQSAQERAYSEVAEELGSELPLSERTTLGMPPAWLATRMLASMQQALSSPTSARAS